jgi:hypothetical protein
MGSGTSPGPVSPAALFEKVPLEDVFISDKDLARIRGGEDLGRVDLGGRSPRPPTDPDVRVKRIWLFIS